MNESLKSNRPVPIEKLHQMEDFDSGIVELNLYLQKHALQNQSAGGARTYVTTINNKVVGYYSLVFGSVSVDETPPRVRKGLGQYPVPVMILARLAIDRHFKGTGLGGGLLKDALARTLQAADIAGLRAVLVHAKDDDAKAFYRRYDFVPSPVHENHLYLLLKDLKNLFK